MSEIIYFKNKPTDDVSWLREAIMGEFDLLNFIGGIQHVNSDMVMAEPKEKQSLFEYHREVMDAITSDPVQLKKLHELLDSMEDFVVSQTNASQTGYVCGAINIDYKNETLGLHLIQIAGARFIRAITDQIPTMQ